MEHAGASADGQAASATCNEDVPERVGRGYARRVVETSRCRGDPCLPQARRRVPCAHAGEGWACGGRRALPKGALTCDGHERAVSKEPPHSVLRVRLERVEVRKDDGVGT